MNNDAVHSPSHYCGGIETIDFIKDKLGWGFIPYCLGNVIKYVSRYDKKGKPLEDLQKAAVYLQWAIEKMEADSNPDFVKLSRSEAIKAVNEDLQKGRCK